jgi:hypothetical protein
MGSQVLPKPSVTRVFALLGRPQPPSSISQEAFDDRLLLDELVRHGRLNGPILDGPLHEYCLCLKYVSPLQPDLMRHAIPLCLEAWQARLFDQGHEDVARAFNSALSTRPDVIAAALDESAARAIMDFMRASILARMSHQMNLRKPEGDTAAHTWMGFFASYGCIWPDVKDVLADWRRSDVAGLAVAAIEYLSLLAYDDREHPLFAASARRPGAVPRPWDYAGEDGDPSKWLPENVDALRSTMTVASVEAWALEAAGRLASHTERDLAALVAEDIALQPYLIESRLGDLVHHMASIEAYKVWSDVYGVSR